MKYTTPNNLLNTEPYGTVWKSQGDETVQIYIQMSRDASKADWRTVDEVLGRVYAHQVDDKDFVEKLLTAFENLS
jgi:hypothetical protein